MTFDAHETNNNSFCTTLIVLLLLYTYMTEHVTKAEWILLLHPIKHVLGATFTANRLKGYKIKTAFFLPSATATALATHNTLPGITGIYIYIHTCL